MPELTELMPERWVLPDYRGAALNHLPPTVGRLLGVAADWRSAPLARPGLPERARQVVVLLVDGLGQARLQRQLAREDAGFLALLERYGALEGGALPPPITSVSPSTTTAATSVIQANGAGPGGLGILGYTQRLPALGVVANMLFFNAAWNRSARVGDLEAWGVTPESMLGAPSIYQLLAAGGVAGHAFVPNAVSRNPLSRMQFQGAEVVGYVDWVDMLTRLGAHLEASAGRPGFSYAYLPDFDSLMHRDGTDSPTLPRLFEAFVPQLRRVLDELSPAARDGTLLLMTADHGHVTTPLEERRLLQRYPSIFSRMALREAGEPRHTFLYARAGAEGELLAAAHEELGDAFVALSGAEALAGGLYGDPAHLHPEADRRVGDVVLLAKGGATMWAEDQNPRMLGMHGSLEPEEMLVPLLALRADA